MKRTLSSIASAFLLLGALAPSAFAASTSAVSYTDINGNFAQQDILSLSQKGFIHGYSNGTFRPNDLVTRGQFLAYFLNVVHTFTGVKPVAHSQFYADIPPHNWDYNYVGAAQAQGWINPPWIGVKIGGRFNENYQASWGDAASFFVSMLQSSQHAPNMHGKAPLAWAKSIGLFNGIPSTQNQIYLNRASASVVLINILNYVNGLQNPAGQGTGTGTSSGGSGSGTSQVPAGATLTLSGGSTIQSNSTEQLTLVMKDGSGNIYNYGNDTVTYSTGSPSAFVSPSGILVATQPGTYQVSATVDGVTSNTLSVTVVGSAAGLKITAAAPSLVVGGTATDTVTATVVDANGNPVTNLNGTVEFKDTNAQLVTSAGATTNDLTGVQVVNGQATVNVRANTVLGSTDTITVTNLVQSGSNTIVTGATGVATASLTVTQVQQIATSIKVVPTSSTLENNVSSEDGFTIQVLDQDGQPMLTGSYPITLNVAGAGKLDSGTPASTYYVGNGNASNVIQGNIWSEQGVSGAITVVAASPGLQTGSAAIQAVTVGSPAALRLAVDSNSSSSFVAGTTGSTFDLSAVDASGNPVTDTANPSYSATIWQGANQITSGVSAQAIGNKVIVSGTTAGTYTLKVTSSDNLNPATTSFTITAATPSKAVITSPSSALDLPVNADTTVIQAQLQDAYGNPVNVAGIPVEFVAVTKAGTDTANIGGSVSGTVTADTNANGQVSINFIGTQRLGDAWTVGIDKVNNVAIPVVSTQINMVQEVPSAMQVGLQDILTFGSNNAMYLHSTSYAQAGDTVQVAISALDSYGHPSSNGDLLQITLPAGFSNPIGLNPTSQSNVYTATLPSSGTLIFTATASQAGVYALQVADLSVPGQNLMGTQTMTIVPGTAVKAALFDQVGEITPINPVSVTGNTPVLVWLKPVDAEGNPVNEGVTAQTFTLGDTGANGQFRLASATGVNVTSVQIPAGQAAVSVYYVNANTGNYVLTASN